MYSPAELLHMLHKTHPETQWWERKQGIQVKTDDISHLSVS